MQMHIEKHLYNSKRYIKMDNNRNKKIEILIN